MTTKEFSDMFDTLLNSYSLQNGFGDTNSLREVVLDEYEKSVFLTRAQEQLIISYYSGNNSGGEAFENTEEYRSLGAYDTWEQSPFRTGVLNGSNYVSIVANPDMEEKDAPGVSTNASENVLAVQRSRYGSNTFGARIDLNEPFCLGTSAVFWDR